MQQMCFKEFQQLDENMFCHVRAIFLFGSKINYKSYIYYLCISYTKKTYFTVPFLNVSVIITLKLLLTLRITETKFLKKLFLPPFK